MAADDLEHDPIHVYLQQRVHRLRAHRFRHKNDEEVRQKQLEAQQLLDDYDRGQYSKVVEALENLRDKFNIVEDDVLIDHIETLKNRNDMPISRR